MRSSLLLSVLLISQLFTAAHAETALTVLPKQVTLTGSRTQQRLIVEAQTAEGYSGDLTAKAKFVSSAPNIATVDRDGTVHALKDGAVTITALVGKSKATAQVRVAGASKPIQWSFRNHVLPILTKAACNSGACHGAAAGKGGLKLSLRGYDHDADYNVITRQAGGRRVFASEPQNSLLLQKPTMEIGHGGGKRVERASVEYARIAGWISAGIPRPKATDARLLGVEAFPDTAHLKPGDDQQIVVLGRYSDGHTEDVTRWVKYGTSESSVAIVDDSGKVKMTGDGEAAITVWYSSKVTFARVSSAYPNRVTADTYAKASRTNFIDDIILKKLQSLRIPPSAVSTDSAFLRRVYLDTCGILPTADEATAFLMDTSPDKRTRVIDSLLARPEFVDYWTYKWSDLLLVSSKKLSGAALTTFSNWIRQSVKENRPWNQFTREILTAQGSNLENGAANYYVLHKEPLDITETTTQAFLGMSLTCARCHNHPLEKWTQRDYFQMANLVSRVRLKNGERDGEVMVLSSKEGDINLPRLGVPLPPRPLDGTEITLASLQDRREKLADWVTAPANPYFAKALANRVWRNFMGRGIVESEDDLRLTNPPTNPELLTALADDFVKSGYDVKRLIRTILLSASYQRSADPVAGNEKDERFYSHYIVKRLPAEVLLDCLSQATQAPTSFDGYAKGTRALQLPDSQVASFFLTTFGRPERAQTCACERQQEPSVAQALHLSNGDTVNDKVRAMNNALDTFYTKRMSAVEILDRLYLSAYGRRPTPAEALRIAPLLKGYDVATDGEEGWRKYRRPVLEDLLWSLITSKEFLFNH